jgi:DNA mismatch endonuclease (patch repair protein)
MKKSKGFALEGTNDILSSMADIFSQKKRSEIMAKIKGAGNRSTEVRFTIILKTHRITGWRRHWKLLGKPDFVFPKARLAIFVDGCFWHGCPRCYRAPASNAPFWRLKFERNRMRDLKVKKELRKRGCIVLRFWECELKDATKVSRQIQRALTQAWKIKVLAKVFPTNKG